jgi:hypothetical protein
MIKDRLTEKQAKWLEDTLRELIEANSQTYCEYHKMHDCICIRDRRADARGTLGMEGLACYKLCVRMRNLRENSY